MNASRPTFYDQFWGMMGNKGGITGKTYLYIMLEGSFGQYSIYIGGCNLAQISRNSRLQTAN